LRLLQINLHHSKAASAALQLRLAQGEADLVLVQEPWVVGGKVAGLGTKEYKLMLDPKQGKIRTCILAKRHLNIFLLRNYSNGDNTSVSLELQHGSIRLLSAYMALEKEDPPDALVRGLAKECEELKTDLVIKIYCDNATNFVGASRMLQEFKNHFVANKNAIMEFAATRGITFSFIPPRALHFGGLWGGGQRFWVDWQRDYVLSLQQRQKWLSESHNIEIGTIVVVHKDNSPPQQWLLGIIEK
ncbi:hypothetical protein KR084_010813, partial [Drosophila pseudotakahashii]